MSTSPAQDRTDLPGTLGAGYAAEAEYRPLGGYAVLTAAFGAALAGGLVAARRTGHELPERLDVHDVVLAGIATHKVSRLITKDKVSGFLRAPFTRFQEKSGHGEVEEAARGRGLRYAIGELLVCPYCIAQWVAGGFAVGTVFAPRTTRLLAAMWTAQAISDAAQLAYNAAEERS
jgi:hypothetical protein